MLRAPGSYHHSVIVGTLAEAGAPQRIVIDGVVPCRRRRFSSAALSSSVTWPRTISADTTYYLREPEAFDAYLRRTIVNLSKDQGPTARQR